MTTAAVSPDLIQTLARPRGSMVTCRWSRYCRRAGVANLFSQSAVADLLSCRMALMIRVLLIMNCSGCGACNIDQHRLRRPVDNLRGRRRLR